MYTSDNFKDHIEVKDSVTKGERAEFLYGATFGYDCALPHDWVVMMADNLNVDYHVITSNFVWGYSKSGRYNGFAGGPLPLNLDACDMLAAVEPIEVI